MPRLPQVSGAELGRLLQQLGYEFMRQKGSHARYRLISSAGTHFVTVPMHPVIAKGTLNDILSSVSVWTGVAKDNLIDRL
jgi:predicted RNA binding protein YcfA (HicA-like mRNA interferase family)